MLCRKTIKDPGNQVEQFRAFIDNAKGGLTQALSKRDEPFGDYRTGEGSEDAQDKDKAP